VTRRIESELCARIGRGEILGDLERQLGLAAHARTVSLREAIRHRLEATLR
jgi:hypothetical protein